MGKPQARITDMHMCNIPGPPTPAGPLPPAPLPIAMVGSPNTLVKFLPAARVTDQHISGVGPHPIAMGSFTVMINNLPAARVGDMGACGGAIIRGEVTVLTGG